MRIFKICVLLIAGLLASGCTDATNTESPLPEAEFYELASGSYTDGGTFTKKQIKVITTQTSYNEELLNYSSSAPANIDFTAGQVLLVDMGQRNSGGYSISVTSIDVGDDYVIANVQLVKPGAGCGVTLALTNPYQFVFIPGQKEVLVKESLSIMDCTE